MTDAHGCENDESLFDVMATKKSSLGFHTEVDAPGHGTSGQKLSLIPGFEYSLNDELDFDALCGSQTPFALPAYIPNKLSDTALKQDATAVTQNTHGFSAAIGDYYSGIFSAVPDRRLETSDPRGRLQGIEPCSHHTRTCMVSALKILQALHLPPSVCLSAGAETSDSGCLPPRMTDSVLSINGEAVRLVSDMLECNCSLSSQVQLVLIIICGKLTTWYRAMVRNGYDGFDNSASKVRSTDNNNNNHNHNNSSSSGSSNNSNSNSNHEDHTERVSHQPITVGGYSFDLPLENKIRAQVVFSELQHVEALIKNLSRRVEETRFGNLCNAAAARSRSGQTASSRLVEADETGLVETIHRRVTVFLHEQLQAAKMEITLITNGEHDSGCVSGQSSDLHE
jgi:Aflatoxin regulatory protein